MFLRAGWAPDLAGNCVVCAAPAEAEGFSPPTPLTSVPALRFLAFGGLAPGLVVLSAYFRFGLGGHRGFGLGLGLGLMELLPLAFRCLWPPPGFPWKREGVFKGNSFRREYGGTLGRPRWQRPRRRSIPAWAGEPSLAPHRLPRGGSIPAWAGEPAWTWPPHPDRTGLSPRGRGNPVSYRAIPLGQCAIGALSPLWVYPRVGGGTYREELRQMDHRGLSPRGRGNRWFPGQVLQLGLSPRGRGNLRRIWVATARSLGVYPRVGGGTSIQGI